MGVDIPPLLCYCMSMRQSRPFKLLVVLLYGTQSWIVREGPVVSIRTAKASRLFMKKSELVYPMLDYLQGLGLILSWSRPSPGVCRIVLKAPNLNANANK
jgi:hypothetical protein